MPRRPPALLSVAFLLASLVVRAPAQANPVHTPRDGAKALPPAAHEGAWQFVVYGDRTNGPPEGLDVLRQAVKDTNLLDPDLVLTVGDALPGYTDGPKWLEQMSQYRAIMSGLRMAWYPVAGNHDIYWRGPNPPRGGHEADYERHFGPLWYWFGHKNAAFIVLYTDEGDPETGDQGFGSARVTQMSPTQLRWLEATLSETRSLDHVFVFLHHPRWIASIYGGSNWEAVHRQLAAAGNVRAVFGGHIHHLRFEGRKDGIEYYTLGTTGGSIREPLPQAGWLHHLNLVTVRPGRFTVATVPVGAVIDPQGLTADGVQDVERLLAEGAAPVVQPIEVRADGSGRGTYGLTLGNPATRRIELTLVPQAGSSQIRFIPERVHLALDPGEFHPVTVAYVRGAVGIDDSLRGLSLLVQRTYLAASGRIPLPERTWPMEIELSSAAPPPGPPGTLALDGRTACLRLPVRPVKIPDGPFTVEGWTRPESLKGRRPFVSKAQNSEWGLFLNDGLASWTVHLDGRYAEARAAEKLSEKQWHHLAGVFDGEEVRVYVDGRLAGRTPASGHRTLNSLPAYVGADPDDRGQPIDFLAGRVDEVRISCGVRYARETFEPSRRFEPDPETLVLLHLDQDFGPWCPDSGPRGVHALRLGAATSVAEPAAAGH